MGSRLLATAAALTALAAGAVLGLDELAESGLETPESGTPPETVYVVRSDLEALSSAFATITRKVRPGVVTINSTATVRRIVPGFPMFPSPFSPWGMERTPPREQEFQRRGLGSGVVYSSDGYILTNNHVIEGADDIEVVLHNGDAFSAQVIGTDPRTDVAVIRIEGGDLQRIPFGDSDELMVGEWVLAIGSPFALSQTVTQGIVSYLGRTDLGLADYESYIQTSAAINPGNSGGALVNLHGELVGLNTAIASRTGGSQGVGFAIPINTVLRVAEDLITHGSVLRGWLGVVIQEVDEKLGAQFDAPLGSVLVSDLVPDGPAENQGLQRGDVIVALNGMRVDGISEFRNAIADFEPDTRVEISVLRDGREIDLDVRLGQQPDNMGEISLSPGWRLRSIDPDRAAQMGIESGVEVVDVEPASPAEKAGLQPGDILLEVNRRAVASPQEVETYAAASGDEALLLVLRDNHTLYLVIQTRE